MPISQMATQPLLRLLRNRAPQIRSFSRASPFLKAKSSKPTPPRISKTENTNVAKSLPARTRAPRPSPPAHQTPPTPAHKELVHQGSLGKFLGDSDSMLLYKAPKHTALFVTCTIVGSGIFLWVGDLSHQVFMQWTVPWYAKLIMLGGCMISAAMACAIVSTPYQLIRSISLARNAEQNVVVRVKGTRMIPFLKPIVQDFAPGQITVDKNVVMSLEASERSWYTVPREHGKGWTNGEFTNPDAPRGSALEKFNQRLLNVGPASMRQVRKMLQRDGMAYVRLGNTNWKMDLEGCEIMDHGTVLMKAVDSGVIRKSLVDMMVNKWGSSS